MAHRSPQPVPSAVHPLAEAVAVYAQFCADARVEGADLAAWTDDDSRAALVPAFDGAPFRRRPVTSEAPPGRSAGPNPSV